MSRLGMVMTTLAFPIMFANIGSQPEAWENLHRNRNIHTKESVDRWLCWLSKLWESAGSLSFIDESDLWMQPVIVVGIDERIGRSAQYWFGAGSWFPRCRKVVFVNGWFWIEISKQSVDGDRLHYPAFSYLIVCISRLRKCIFQVHFLVQSAKAWWASFECSLGPLLLLW